MLELFDKDRATIFSHCCGAATHFNPKLPYRVFNTGLLFAMEEIKPYDMEHEVTFSVDTTSGKLHFALVTDIRVRSDPSIKVYTFSGDFMGTGRTDLNNDGVGVFPPDSIKHGQFCGMVTNKTFNQFLEHKGVCLWIDSVSSWTRTKGQGASSFYHLLDKYPEFKKEFDDSVIYKSQMFCNMREHNPNVLQLIITDRGNK